MSLPYLPLFIDDYEADTAHLSLLEDGIYNRLLRLLWRSPRCQVPHDLEWIARKLRANSKAEKDAVASVVSEFFAVRRGMIFSKRLSAERERISVSIQKRKEAGKTGGSRKSLKTKGSEGSNAKAMLKHPEPEPEPYGKPEGFPTGARAREKPKGWVERRTHSQALTDIISRIEQHEQRGIEDDGGSSQTPVQLLPIVRAG